MADRQLDKAQRSINEGARRKLANNAIGSADPNYNRTKVCISSADKWSRYADGAT